MTVFLPLRHIEKVLLFAVPAISVITTPIFSADPINLPKASLLAVCGFAILGLVLPNFRGLTSSLNISYLVVIFIFLVQTLIVLIYSGAPFDQQFYGVLGRNTGFLTYISLVLVSVAAALIANKNNVKKFLYSLFIVALISEVYSLLQTLGKDPIPWTSNYNSITGFLGNPNFQSSFMGISAAVAFAYLIQEGLPKGRKILALLYIALSLVLILRSDSIQGLLVMAIGTLVCLTLFLISSQKFGRKKIIFPYLFLVGSCAVLVVLGTINIGPLSDFLYKASVRQRGYYWDAAIEMTRNHPFFGVGFDSFGDWYFQSRSADAALNSLNVTTNSPHNVFLEMGAIGGFPLFFAYIALILLTLRSSFNLIKNGRASFDWILAGAIGAWVAYLSQSLISVNQIGLAVWGWVLMGLIIGSERNLRKEDNLKIPLSKNNSPGAFLLKTRDQGARLTVLFVTLCTVAALAIVIPPLRNDAAYRTAFESKSAEKLIAAVLAKPEAADRSVDAVQLLAQSGLFEQANSLIDHVTDKYPRNHNAWYLKVRLVDENSEEYKLIVEKINELNPRAPYNK
jgi:O-antigen ligase